MNFHIIPVGSGVIRDVILNNTSKCPVTFEIVLPLKYRPDPEDPQPQAKIKDNKCVPIEVLRQIVEISLETWEIIIFCNMFNRLKNPPLKCGPLNVIITKR